MPTPALNLRMPATMAEQVRRLAKAEGVSMNTLLVSLIARGLADHPRTDDKSGVA